MDTPSVAELEQHKSQLEDRIMQVAAEVRELLADDLPKFLEREMKRMFVSHPDFASGVSEATLREVKRSTAEAGVALAATVAAALADDAVWLPESVGENDDRRSIADNTALWDRVSGPAVDAVRALLDRYGFPTGDAPTEYKAPTWFVGRRYLPSLSERYWRHIREYAEARAQIGSIRKEASRSELTRRWDEAD